MLAVREMYVEILLVVTLFVACVAGTPRPRPASQKQLTCTGGQQPIVVKSLVVGCQWGYTKRD